jgi:hypothetical protein
MLRRLILIVATLPPLALAQTPTSYVDLPLSDLTHTISTLKSLQPAADQQALPEILQKSGRNVDFFFDSLVDLSAHEKITQQRLHGKLPTATEHVEDSYLILRQGDESSAPNVREFRTDAQGNQLGPVGLNKGFLITFGFALMCNYFSSAMQPESQFRYLGDQKIDEQETYVIAFAQKPEAKLFVSFADASGATAKLFVQGIAWVDKSNFQIIRIRTDLLSAPPGIALERQSTEVTLSRIQLADVSTPLWLPQEVKVELKYRQSEPGNERLGELVYRNDHHYSDYRRYRVSVKMLPSR